SSLLAKINTMLIQTVSNRLKVKIEDIDLDTELNEYGFDSISLTDFTNQLNQQYELELNPTVFFEYSTLDSFGSYLVREHEAVFARKYRVETKPQAVAEPIEIEAKPTTVTATKRRPRFVTTHVTAARKNEPVAIIGMSGCFPGAENLEQFWNNLVDEKEAISEIPADRWDWKSLYGNPHLDVNKSNIKWGGFINSLAEFDPLFFGISPREAELMDPQQRLLMTYIYLAIEDANYSASSLSGSNTGIFVGTGISGYTGLLSKTGTAIEGYTSTGTVPSVGPNRMSYFLNLHGPSEAIETACSSSLVAIHRAVQAMNEGNCDAAFVGGVNTIITPDSHISFNKAGMLSEDGRCKTFSSAANGYVRGEGVGILFLKKLSHAEADHDHIYGVIRGSAENHGGRANSLTAPNPKAQAELLKTAYKKSGLHPETISYIEAHGTGTELGDPIEINGLKTAFKELYQEAGDVVKKAHCGLGSVKTNIGHLELAAGAAGVIKVLLQFKHQKLVKTLHCDEVNPYIDLKESPFYIVQETKHWNRLKNDSGQEIPRRAGVSSFGFGGANAHVVLEEYTPGTVDLSPMIHAPDAQTTEPVIIALSARTKKQLEQRASDLLAFLRSSSSLNLNALAYTLQTGREAMEERLGLIVTSVHELQEKLTSFLSGNQAMDVYVGQVKRNKENMAVFTADEELQEAIEKWIDRKKISKLLDLWVKGFQFDWNKLYGDSKPQRISVPTYPFAKERYWVYDVHNNEMALPAGNNISLIHPLLHENTSDLSEQRFTSRFRGTEFFISDYQVDGQKTLPAVAFLEMARAAVAYAIPAPQGSTILELRDVLWAQPFGNSQAKQISIALLNTDNEEIEYEIYSSEAQQERIYCQGKAILSNKPSPIKLDIEQLKKQMLPSNLDITSVYVAFAKIGIHYGVSYQGVTAIYQGNQQLLAELSLPDVVASTRNNYLLHPSIMDSALQASIGLISDLNDLANQLSFPSAMNSLSIISPCTQKMFAWMRYSLDAEVKNKITNLDIDLTDTEGNVCVQMKGLKINTVSINDSPDPQSNSKLTSYKSAAAHKQSYEQISSEVLPVPSSSHPLVIIGGAGLFGLCMGVFLKRANISFKIIEKNEDVGGVWFINRWPGCGCDIPMLA
ncbi:MAG: Mycocerosate synthase, 6-deoxyerythronolide-B synthase, partial [Cellvibrio sp.]|nr:Mycocerosate synthase, 6-deoxyerythronolide-B synthase [Cellvibrio sp.]